MAPLSVFETCDCTATDAKFFGRYLRARATDMKGGVGGRRAGRDAQSRAPARVPPATERPVARGPQRKSGRRRPRRGTGCRPDTPGLTELRKTPHAAATCGVLTGLAGSRPPGPGAAAR